MNREAVASRPGDRWKREGSARFREPGERAPLGGARLSLAEAREAGDASGELGAAQRPAARAPEGTQGRGTRQHG